MANEVEKEWITEAGLQAVCLIAIYGERRSHRCGYVGITEDHPLYGVEYSDQADCILQDAVDSASVGKKGAMIALTAACNSDAEDKIRRSPDIIFDVHGGLTYSGGSEKYPIPRKGVFWYGFDCNHCDDGEIETDSRFGFMRSSPVRDLEYVVSECERLAKQLAEFADKG